MQAEEVDPRLIALGLVPPPAAAPPTTSDAPPAPPPPTSPPAPQSEPIDIPNDPESPWLAKIRRAAAAERALTATPSTASAFPQDRFDAVMPPPPAKGKEKKVKAPKVKKIKAPKIKETKVKAPKVEPPRVAPPPPVEPPQIAVVKAEPTRLEAVRVEAPPKPKEVKVKAPKIKEPKLAVPKPEVVREPPFKPDPNATLIFVHTVRYGMRTIPLELWSDRVTIGDRHVPWQSITAVTARAGRVHIEGKTKQSTLDFIPSVDGVPEPTLAPLFVEIVLDGSSGAPPRDKLVRALADGKADTKYRFRERDDASISLLIILIFVLAAPLLAVVFPLVIVLPFRGGLSVGSDTFLIYSRLSALDPRALVAAIAAAMILSRGAMRAAAGPDLMLWARGTAAGWNRAKKLRTRLGRIIAAHMLLHLREYVIALAVALILLLPTARERVLVDGDGVHIRGSLPFFDRDVPWSNIDAPNLLPRGGGLYDVVLSTKGGGIGSTLVDTTGTVFYGLSPYELAQFAKRMEGLAP